MKKIISSTLLLLYALGEESPGSSQISEKGKKHQEGSKRDGKDKVRWGIKTNNVKGRQKRKGGETM